MAEITQYNQKGFVVPEDRATHTGASPLAMVPWAVTKGVMRVFLVIVSPALKGVMAIVSPALKAHFVNDFDGQLQARWQLAGPYSLYIVTVITIY